MNEHEAMTSCECREADRLSFVCVACGRVWLFDPAWFFIGAAVLLMAWNLWAWMTL